MSEDSKNGINWKQILITAIVTGIVGILTGSVLFHIQQKQPQLSYQIANTIPFMGDKERLAIHNVIIKNGGKAIVKNVDCSISLLPADVKEKKVSADPSLKFSDATKGSEYTIHIDNINPEEKISISILSSSQTDVPVRPKVALRGEGYIGKEIGNEENKSFFQGPLFTAVTSAYAVLLVLSTLIMLRKKRLIPIPFFKDDSTHSDDQNQILAYLFGVAGMIGEAESYLQKTRTSSYWSESDRIAASAIKANDSTKIEAYKSVLMNLLDYAKIAESSVGIIHYNIARIAKFQNQNEEAKLHLDKARKAIPNLLTKRLQIDPIFKTQANNSI